MKKLKCKGIEFLSTEFNNTPFKPEKDDFETINKYIITTDDIRDWKKEDMTYIHINSYLLFHLYTFIYILIFIIIIYILFHYYTPIKINKKKNLHKNLTNTMLIKRVTKKRFLVRKYFTSM